MTGKGIIAPSHTGCSASKTLVLSLVVAALVVALIYSALILNNLFCCRYNTKQCRIFRAGQSKKCVCAHVRLSLQTTYSDKKRLALVLSYLIYSLSLGVLVTVSTSLLFLKIFCSHDVLVTKRDRQEISPHHLIGRQVDALGSTNEGSHLSKNFNEVISKSQRNPWDTMPRKVNDGLSDENVSLVKFSKASGNCGDSATYGFGYSGGGEDGDDDGRSDGEDDKRFEKGGMTNGLGENGLSWLDESSKQMHRAIFTIRHSIIANILGFGGKVEDLDRSIYHTVKVGRCGAKKAKTYAAENSKKKIQCQIDQNNSSKSLDSARSQLQRRLYSSLSFQTSQLLALKHQFDNYLNNYKTFQNNVASTTADLFHNLANSWIPFYGARASNKDTHLEHIYSTMNRFQTHEILCSQLETLSRCVQISAFN